MSLHFSLQTKNHSKEDSDHETEKRWCVHERKVMQNLSNATTKIQLNSIPEEKTSKRKTFFFVCSVFGKSAKRHRDKEKKTFEILFSKPPSREEILFSYFCMLLSFLPCRFHRLFHLFYLQFSFRLGV